MAAMASKVAALLLLFNLAFFTCVSSTCPPVTEPKKPTKPPVTTSPPVAKLPKCPKDTLKLGACADVLSGLVHLVVGSSPSSSCCSLLTGLTNLEAAVCLCTAIKANVLGVIKLDVPVALSLLVNTCGKKVPSGYKCA